MGGHNEFLEVGCEFGGLLHKFEILTWREFKVLFLFLVLDLRKFI